MPTNVDPQDVLLSKSDKDALLTYLRPFFSQDATFPEMPSDTFAYTHWERNVYEAHMLPYWISLAEAYRQALAMPFGHDTGALETKVEDWPGTFSAQQKSLYELLQTSKLKMAWRGYCQWSDVQRTSYTEGQRKVFMELEREHMEGSTPLREIPLYVVGSRSSCQQVVCMPVAAWESMYSSNSSYEPGQIDRATVERLATRIAQVFNAPPLVPLDLLHLAPSWPEAVVWTTSQRGLNCDINSHGMTDRLEGEHCQKNGDPQNLEYPEWRYRGFGGQIRVTLEDGTPWYVTVLAPTHFVRHMMRYREQLAPVAAPENTTIQP